MGLGISTKRCSMANGEALQGFDSNHTRTRLLDCAQGGEHYEMLLNLYAGAEIMRARSARACGF